MLVMCCVVHSWYVVSDFCMAFLEAGGCQGAWSARLSQRHQEAHGPRHRQGIAINCLMLPQLLGIGLQ